MTNPELSTRPCHVLVHQMDGKLGGAWADLLGQRYRNVRVLLAPDCGQAVRHLEAEPVDFCVLDLDDAGGAELLFDVLTVLPAAGVLPTSARPPGQRPTLSDDIEARVLPLNPACTPAVLCETVGEILGLEAAPSPVAAPELGLPPETRRITGNLQILLPDLVQLKCLTGRSCVLEINTRHDAGQIFFERGNIVHACTRHLEGIAALLAVFGWKNSHFIEGPWWEPPARSIHQRWESVLLELSRMTDEARGDSDDPALHDLETAA